MKLSRSGTAKFYVVVYGYVFLGHDWFRREMSLKYAYVWSIALSLLSNSLKLETLLTRCVCPLAAEGKVFPESETQLWKCPGWGVAWEHTHMLSEGFLVCTNWAICWGPPNYYLQGFFEGTWNLLCSVLGHFTQNGVEKTWKSLVSSRNASNYMWEVKQLGREYSEIFLILLNI